MRCQRLVSDRLPAASMPCAERVCCLQLPSLLVCHCKLSILAFLFLISSVLAFHCCILFISKAMLEVEILTWRTQIKVLILPIVQRPWVSGSRWALSQPWGVCSQEKRQLFYNPTAALGKEISHDTCFPALGVSPSTSYNFSSTALSASDFLTGKVPSLPKHHGWRPSLQEGRVISGHQD